MLLPRKTQRSNAETRSAKETAHGVSLSQDFSYGPSALKTLSELAFSDSFPPWTVFPTRAFGAGFCGDETGKPFMSVGFEGERKRRAPHSLTHTHAAIARGNQAKICFRSELWLLKRKLLSFNQPFYFFVVAFF